MRKYPGENKIAKTLREIYTERVRARARTASDIYENCMGIRALKFYVFSSGNFICRIDKIHGSGALPLIIIPCCPTNCERLLQNDTRLTTSPLLLLVITRCRCWNSNPAINPIEECVDAYAWIILIKRTKVCSALTSAPLYFSFVPLFPERDSRTPLIMSRSSTDLSDFFQRHARSMRYSELILFILTRE